MVKRKKHADGRSAFDNPLAAARSGKATTTSTTKKEGSKLSSFASGSNGNGNGNGNGTGNSNSSSGKPVVVKTDWVEFESTTPSKTAAKKDRYASKMSKKAEQIWHRRSGAGFHLFVDYYMGQPDGVVATTVTQETEAGASSQPPPRSVATPSTGGAGQSRAALRRKKKKRRKTTTNDNNDNDNNEASLPQVTTIVPIHQHDQLLYKGRLLDVLSSKTTSTNNNPPSDFRNFLTALSKPLPLTFRFRRYEGSTTNTDDADDGNDDEHPPTTTLPSKNQQQTKRRIQKIAGLRQILKSKTLAKTNVRPVSFDPEYIYQAVLPPMVSGRKTATDHHPFPVDKNSLKRLCPELKEFLNEHTLDGTIARQELGSMLPVWLLDKVGAFSSSSRSQQQQQQYPNNRLLRVLDTCASPGSKTLQVAELLSLSTTPRGGRVRANDVNAKRLETLLEALERSGFFGTDDGHGGDGGGSSSSSADAYTNDAMDAVIKFSNVDATVYPIPKSEAKKYPIILCDVPCSGDGTCRKDVHVIPNWTPSISNALHSLQVKILSRALECVALGGIVSYSTCSLNPIEDEAVVGAALEKARKDGKATPQEQQQQQPPPFEFELVEVSNARLNGLVLHPGVRSWRVADFDPNSAANSNHHTNDPNETKHDDEKDASSDADTGEDKPAKLTWYDSYQSALEDGMEGIQESMWPQAVAEKDDETSPSLPLPLDRCLRLFPQDQDTGGFFVALIRRTK